MVRRSLLMSLMSFCQEQALYAKQGWREKENAGSELVRTRVNDRGCVGVEANEVAKCN